ncbi:uncharacterized protein [Dermacentor albipictus]|uniref:uncharacterized protein n=1 Tax=Dermacentor albipictus TaxID=60249 RepID=UPI0031FCCB75
MGQLLCFSSAMILIALIVQSDEAQGGMASDIALRPEATQRYQRILGCGHMHYQHGHFCKKDTCPNKHLGKCVKGECVCLHAVTTKTTAATTTKKMPKRARKNPLPE